MTGDQLVVHPNGIKTVQCVLYRIVFEINIIKILVVPQMSPVQIPKLHNVFLLSSKINIKYFLLSPNKIFITGFN